MADKKPLVLYTTTGPWVNIIPATLNANWNLGTHWSIDDEEVYFAAWGSSNGVSTPKSFTVSPGTQYFVEWSSSYFNTGTFQVTIGGTAGTAWTSGGAHSEYITAATNANVSLSAPGNCQYIIEGFKVSVQPQTVEKKQIADNDYLQIGSLLLATSGGEIKSPGIIGINATSWGADSSSKLTIRLSNSAPAAGDLSDREVMLYNNGTGGNLYIKSGSTLYTIAWTQVK